MPISELGTELGTQLGTIGKKGYKGIKDIGKNINKGLLSKAKRRYIFFKILISV